MPRRIYGSSDLPLTICFTAPLNVRPSRPKASDYEIGCLETSDVGACGCHLIVILNLT